MPALEVRPPDVTESVDIYFELTCKLQDLMDVEETHMLASTAVAAARAPDVYEVGPRPPATIVKLTDPVDPTLLFPDFPDVQCESYDRL